MTRVTLRNGTFLILASVFTGCRYDSATRYSGTPDPTIRDGLWTASAAAPTILRLAPTQLLTSGNSVPSTAIFTSSAELFNLNGIAFDTDGTLWVTSEDDALLVAFSPTALASSGHVVASRVIASRAGSLSAPTSVAFDARHRLWVANSANGTIVRFDRGQLASSGSPTPTVVISGVGRPTSLAFDASGSLWVSDVQANTIMKFGAEQLEVSGAPAPDVRLAATDNSLANPSGLAFDAAGNLWVANGRQSVISFSVAQLATSGSPVPHIVLALGPPAVTLPEGIAFDGDGSLWVISNDGRLAKYDRSSLGASGAPLPSVRLVLTGYVLFWSLAFWPAPAGLPLH